MEIEDLTKLTQEALLGELKMAEEQLEDLYEERRIYLGQTGVHVGVRQLERFRRQIARDEERLLQHINSIKALMDT